MEEDKEVARQKERVQQLLREWSSYYLFEMSFVEHSPDKGYMYFAEINRVQLQVQRESAQARQALPYHSCLGELLLQGRGHPIYLRERESGAQVGEQNASEAQI